MDGPQRRSSLDTESGESTGGLFGHCYTPALNTMPSRCSINAFRHNGMSSSVKGDICERSLESGKSCPNADDEYNDNGDSGYWGWAKHENLKGRPVAT